MAKSSNKKGNSEDSQATEASVNTHVTEAAQGSEQNTPAPSKEKKPAAVYKLSETKRRIDS